MYKSLLIFLLCCLPLCLGAQHLRTEIKLLPSLMYNGTFDGAYEGSGLHLAYLHPISEGQLIAGIDADLAWWGSELLINAGYAHPLAQKDKLSLSGELVAQAGIALFRPSPIFVWGLEANLAGRWQMSRRTALELAAGLNCIDAPGYEAYGAITSYVNLPIRLGLVFRLGELED